MVEKTEVEITREQIKLLWELVELVERNNDDDYSVSSMEEVILKEEELKKLGGKEQKRLTLTFKSGYLKGHRMILKQYREFMSNDLIKILEEKILLLDQGRTNFLLTEEIL